MTVLKTTRNKLLIITFPIVIFGCMQFSNPNLSLLGFTNIVLLGLAFVYMFIKTGSLWMPIGFHTAWNFVQRNIFGIHVANLEAPALEHTVVNPSAPPLMEYSSVGSDFLTGGSFGIEGGLICSFVIFVLFIFIHYGIKPSEPPAWTFESDLPFK